MKRFIFLVLTAATAFLPFRAGAQQDDALVIEYDMVLDLNKLSSYRPEIAVLNLKPGISTYRYTYAQGKSEYRLVGHKTEFRAIELFVIYKDLENNYMYHRAAGDSTAVKRDTLECPKWQLQPGETRTILGYLCHKAVSGESIAWYCEAIPVPDGPEAELCGLPGMILACERFLHTITATRIELSAKGVRVALPEVERYLSEEEFARRIGSSRF